MGEIAVGAAVSEIIKLSVSNGLKLLENNFSSDLKGLSKYKSKYIDHCANFLKIKTIASTELAVYIEDIYVPLDVLKPGHSVSFDINSNTTLDQARAVLIKGIAGQGKSTILRKLLSNNLRKGKRLPLFYELKNYKGGDIENALINQLQFDGIDLKRTAMEALLRSSNVVVFLDAFDEAHPNYRNELADEIRKLTVRYMCHIVCTTRPETEIDALTTFDTYTVCVLNEEKIFQIIHKVATDTEKANELCKALERSSLHNKQESVLKTPILVMLYSMSYNLGEDIPDTLSQFYSNIFETVFYKHDNIKGKVDRVRHWNDNRRIYRELFETLCFASQKTGQTSFSGQELNDLIATALEVIQKDAQLADTISDEIRKITNLIIEDGYNEYRFVHKSIQEFFSAMFIRNLPHYKKVEFYKGCLINVNLYSLFSTTMTFLKELDYFDYCEYFLVPSVNELLQLNGSEIDYNTFRIPKDLLNLYLEKTYIRSRIVEISISKQRKTTEIQNEKPSFYDNGDLPHIYTSLFNYASEVLASTRPDYNELCKVVRLWGNKGKDQWQNLTLKELIKLSKLTEDSVETCLLSGIASSSFICEYNLANQRLGIRKHNLKTDNIFDFS